MENNKKAVVYEMHIEDMLHAIQERMDEMKNQKLDDFGQGRQLAYTEMWQIITTRHNMILDLISEDK